MTFAEFMGQFGEWYLTLHWNPNFIGVSFMLRGKVQSIGASFNKSDDIEKVVESLAGNIKVIFNV